ncbi:MAG: helix-turn-helix domain-containing protein [Planctomycetota bacterium]
MGTVFGEQANPKKTLRYYREQGLLKATRIGKRLRYQRKELLIFLDRLTERTEKHT